MTIEELKAFFDSDEGSEALSQIIAEKAPELGYKSPDEVQGLVRKRDELLGTVKKLKTQPKGPQISEGMQRILEALQDEGIEDEDSFSEFIQGKAQEGEGSAEASKQLRELKRQLKQIEKEKSEFSQYKDLFEAERKARLESVKDSTLTQALKKVHVKGDAFDIVKSWAEKQTALDIDDDGKISIYANDSEGLNPSIEAYLEEWSKTDAAKPFIEQPVNTGAGVRSGASKNGVFTREQLATPEGRKAYREATKSGQAVTIAD